MSAATAKPTLDIQPGQTVTVKIVRKPASAAAAKTLARLLSKDASTTSAQRHSKVARNRAMTVKTRGGRPWEHRPTKIAMFKGEVGEQGTILASPDVIRDLGSVARFVEVAKA